MERRLRETAERYRNLFVRLEQMKETLAVALSSEANKSKV